MHECLHSVWATGAMAVHRLAADNKEKGNAMNLRRRSLLWSAGALALASVPGVVQAQNTNATNALRLGITLEPPGLDPTLSASSSIGEITLYNVYETLVKISAKGAIEPLLAQSWEVSDDVRVFTFHLRPDVTFHNGVAFNAQTAAFSLARAGAGDSTNKDRSAFSNIQEAKAIDAHTLRITLAEPDADFLFRLGMATAVMLEPGSVAQNRTQPTGTGPYQLQNWRRGTALTLKKWAGYRMASHIAIEQATFRFISDPAAQTAALLAGDLDVFARAAVARSLASFERQPLRFQVIKSNSFAKTLLGINHRHPQLRDVRVRRAICMAINRQEVIIAAADGDGVPIGSHYTPGMPGYIDTTGINPYDPQRAKALLAESGVQTPLTLRLILPSAPYARRGGELIAAMLAQVGISTRIQNVEWAQWLSSVYTQHDFDLSIVSHVEPLDLDNYTKPGYYWGYSSPAFNNLYQQIRKTTSGDARNALLAQAQRLLALDAVNAWLYQPQWTTVAHARVQGLWQDMPIFVNDLTQMSWRAA